MADEKTVKLVTDIGDGRITTTEAAAVLQTIAAIRRFLDNLERQIELTCVPAHDDHGIAS
jgi:hypothetical protein